MSSQQLDTPEILSDRSGIGRFTPRYKQSEVGLIPEDWETPTIQELVDPAAAIRYGIVQVGRHVDFGIPIIAIKYIRDILRSPLHHASPDVESLYAGSRVKEGDVLISIKGTIGRVGVVPDGFAGNISRDLARLRPNDRVLSNYLAYQLEAPHTQARISQATVGTTRLEFSIATLRNFRLPLPPTLREQARIAEALDDADALIESLERLLAKKRDLKQAAMQQLLTGKKRLPGFGGEWKTRRLSELADIRSGGTPNTTNSAFWGGGVLWCTPTDITDLNGFKYLSTTSRTISKLGLTNSSAELIPPRSIIMTSRATIGECAINTVAVATNQGFKNFVPFDDVDVEFLYYLLCTQRQGFLALCGGSTFLEIGKTQLARYEVTLPKTKEEQIAISSVLSDIDAELTAIEAKIAKARQIKTGMMQELLTGKTRLV